MVAVGKLQTKLSIVRTLTDKARAAPFLLIKMGSMPVPPIAIWPPLNRITPHFREATISAVSKSGP